MTRRFKQIRLELRLAVFSLLILFPVFSQLNATAQIPSPLDRLSIDSSGENNPLTDEQDTERLLAPALSLETSPVAVAIVEEAVHYLYPQRVSCHPSSPILRC
jgi:hypothetical protein